MNILPKKSWHVRNKDNIERVRRDEAKAAEEEKERQTRIAIAESEARTDLLRQRARKRKNSEEESDVQTTSVVQHINFFQDLEDGKKLSRKNEDYEKEKKEEREKQEKAIGLLTHLGQGSMELEGKSPWYLDKSLREKKKEPSKPVVDSKKTEEIDTKRKRSLDPMLSMAKYIDQTEKVHKSKANSSGSESRKKHKSKDHVGKSYGPQQGKTIEELRAERLRREQMERMRQNQILAKARGEKDTTAPKEDVVDERLLPYNSAFNPDLVTSHKSKASNQRGRY